MCDSHHDKSQEIRSRTIPVTEAVGTVLAHDITEIRPGEFKDRAFKKGHVVSQEDICHLQRLGKEHLYALSIPEDEMQENDAAYAIANALMGEAVSLNFLILLALIREKKDYPKSPSKNCTNVNAEIDAVSALRILFPSDVTIKPLFSEAETSSLVKPPSGPTKM